MPRTRDESRGDAPRLSALEFLREFARTHSRPQVAVCAVALGASTAAVALAGTVGEHGAEEVFSAVWVAACYIALVMNAFGSRRVQQWIWRR